MNKEPETITTAGAIAHALIVVFFGLACRLLWGLLHVSAAVPLGGHALPAYTRLCLGVGPTVLTALVVAAAFYCIWACTRKGDRRPSWVAFLSTTTAILSFTMLLVLVAAYLPLMSALNLLAHK
jgi:hypothetical protein